MGVSKPIEMVGSAGFEPAVLVVLDKASLEFQVNSEKHHRTGSSLRLGR